MSDDYDDEEVGYKKPPKRNRFKKGQSRNPSGRPRKKSPGYILDRTVPMQVLGTAGTGTMTEAALLSLLQKGLKEKNPGALKSFLWHMHRLRPEPPETDNEIRVVRWGDLNPGKTYPKKEVCDDLLEVLGIVRQVQRERPNGAPAFAMESCYLEEALKRYDGEKLSDQIIERIVKQTTDPVRAREILTHHFCTMGRPAYSPRSAVSAPSGTEKVPITSPGRDKLGRFGKGYTGNPGGRPRKKSANKSLLWDQLFPAEYNGKNERVRPEVAALLGLFILGRQGDRQAMAGFLAFNKKFPAPAPKAAENIRIIVRVPMRPGRPDDVIGAFGIVKFSPDGYYVEDWVIAEALKRNPSIDLAGRDLKALASVASNKPLAEGRFVARINAAARKSEYIG